MNLKLAILTLLVLNVSSLWAKELVIISDLDETLRVANVEKKFKAGIKLIGGVKPYEGLTAIFQDIKLKNPDAKFYYLSNSFPFLYNGKKWVKENGLPAGEVFQRSLKDKSDSFKSEKLKQIGANHSDASILMFGDNIEHDPKFYSEFKAQSQISDIRIFIRDARLLLETSSSEITYFQTDAQITDELESSLETIAKVNALSFDKLVPKFLVKNLKKRLIKECKTAAVSCSEMADARVQEVIKTIAPTETLDLLAEYGIE
jgi:phosphatidate phosphatase APP1